MSADDTAILGCINGDGEEHRSLIKDFVIWCQANQLQLNTSKTKEMAVDFGKSRPHLQPVKIEGEEVEVQAVAGQQTRLDHQLSLLEEEGPGQVVLPEEAAVLYHLQETLGDVLPVCVCQNSFLR